MDKLQLLPASQGLCMSLTREPQMSKTSGNVDQVFQRQRWTVASFSVERVANADHLLARKPAPSSRRTSASNSGRPAPTAAPIRRMRPADIIETSNHQEKRGRYCSIRALVLSTVSAEWAEWPRITSEFEFLEEKHG